AADVLLARPPGDDVQHAVLLFAPAPTPRHVYVPASSVRPAPGVHALATTTTALAATTPAHAASLAAFYPQHESPPTASLHVAASIADDDGRARTPVPAAPAQAEGQQ